VLSSAAAREAGAVAIPATSVKADRVAAPQDAYLYVIRN
jgi:hypothetical protein